MTTMGFTGDEQHGTFTLIAFVMHISLVDFDQGSSGEGSRISSATIEAATCAASLVGIRMGEFEAGLCNKTYVDPQKKCAIDIPVDVGPAQASRDSLAKMVYELLFLWLVKRINDAINVTSQNSTRDTSQRNTSAADPAASSFIGVLDIFGFETFDFNTFEQLCVNYANEKLQQQFNESMFRVQQEEYREEKIKWEGVADFPDNSKCISLIEGTGNLKPGIIGTLSAACAPFTRGEVPRTGADSSFADKLYKHFEGKSDRFVTSHSMKGWKRFGVVHYAGLVEYETEGFIRKNMDLVSSRCRDMIKTATLPILGAIFDAEEARRANATRRSSAVGPSAAIANSSKQSRRGSRAGGRGSLKQVTIAEGFRRQLNSLMSTISRTTSWYVRCIKPNDENVPDMLEEARLLEQLRYGGVLEAVRVTREGYPCRIAHAEFISKFNSMKSSQRVREASPSSGESGTTFTNLQKGRLTDADECRNILDDAGLLDLAQCQVGLTKVFMRQECYDFIEAWRWKRMTEAAIKMQAHRRGTVQRKQYHRWRFVLVKAVIRIRLWLKARRERKARERWAGQVMSRVLLKWMERRSVWAAKRTIYACWRRRQVNTNIERRKVVMRKQAEEDAKLVNQLKRAREEPARAHERIVHLEQSEKVSAAATAMAPESSMSVAQLPSEGASRDLDLVAKHEELWAMNEKLLCEQAGLHKLVADKVEVNTQLAMYITELADELEEVKLFRDALLTGEGSEEEVWGDLNNGRSPSPNRSSFSSMSSERLRTESPVQSLPHRGAVKKTLHERVTQLAEQLGIDDSLPLAKTVIAANQAMGFEPTGSIMQQVDELMTMLGL